LTEARQARTVTTMRLFSGKDGRRLVFAYSAVRASNIAVEEFPLVGKGVLNLAHDASLRGLRYALYVGSFPSARELVATNQAALPKPGATTSLIAPFGADWYLLVVSPKGPLDSTYSQMLAYAVGIIGLLLVIGGAIVAEHLVWRQEAELPTRDLDDTSEPALTASSKT
jgi:hypothetical protein